MKVSANHLLVVCGDNSVIKIRDYKKDTLVYMRYKRRYVATTLNKLTLWYKAYFSQNNMLELTRQQIDEYMKELVC